jgi:cell division septal protein FtsQ
MNLTAILGFLSGFFSVFSSILEYFKKEEIKNEGKNEIVNEISIKEVEINRRQTEVLIKDEKREDTIKKLENGTF